MYFSSLYKEGEVTQSDRHQYFPRSDFIEAVRFSGDLLSINAVLNFLSDQSFHHHVSDDEQCISIVTAREYMTIHAGEYIVKIHKDILAIMEQRTFEILFACEGEEDNG